MGQVRLLWGALAFVAVLLVAVAYRTSLPGLTATPDTAVAQEGSTQTVAIPEQSLLEALPTIRVVAEDADAATQRVVAEFKAAFSGFDTLDLIDSDFADQQGVAPDPMGFVLTAARADDQGGVRVELKSLGSGKVLLNRILPTAMPDRGAVADVVANVASDVAPVSGLIYGYLDQGGLQSQLTECLTLNDAYYMEQGAGAASLCVPVPRKTGWRRRQVPARLCRAGRAACRGQDRPLCLSGQSIRRTGYDVRATRRADRRRPARMRTAPSASSIRAWAIGPSRSAGCARPTSSTPTI